MYWALERCLADIGGMRGKSGGHDDVTKWCARRGEGKLYRGGL